MSKRKYNHADLVHEIAEIIRKAKPGDQLANDRELAEFFGVSNVTVRAAMLELAKEGLVSRRVGAGTFVLDASARQHIAIAVTQDLLRSLRMPYVHTAAMSILDSLNHQDLPYKLYMVPKALNEHEDVDWPQPIHIERCGLAASMRRNEIRALICIAIGCNNGWASPLESRNVPIIGMSGDSSFRNRVGFYDEPYIRKAVRYLAAFGRTRIGLLSWLQLDKRNSDYDAGVTAMSEELERLGLPFHPEWVRNDADPHHPASGWQAFREIWTANSSERPDALVIADDRLFSSASSAILQMGIKVPKDIQIVTHWNKDSGVLCPFPVARYEYDAAKVGDIICGMMTACLKNPNHPPQLEIVKGEWFTEAEHPSIEGDGFLDAFADDNAGTAPPLPADL
jgi:DNA-binding transcriptional regulator YhcF (GntR family)